MEHHCHAKDCKQEVPPRLLMCLGHWRLVPRRIQHAVNDAFNPRQCQQVQDRPHPSGAWMVAADAAICAVWLQEATHVVPDEALRVCYLEMWRAARYALHLGEDWKEVLSDMQGRVPPNFRALREALGQLLQHAALPERVLVRKAQSTRVD